MEKIFENATARIFLYHENKTIEFEWLSTENPLQADQYKEKMQLFAQKQELYKMPNCIIDAYNLNFDFTEELQTWTITHISPRLAKTGLKRIAYITSQNEHTATQIDVLKC